MGNPINFGKTKLIYHAQINCAVSKSYKFPEFTEKTISQNAYQGKESDRTHYYRNEGFFPTLFFLKCLKISDDYNISYFVRKEAGSMR